MITNYLILNSLQLQLNRKVAINDKGDILVVNSDGTTSPIEFKEDSLIISPIKNEWDYNQNLMYVEDFKPRNQTKIRIESAIHQNEIRPKSDPNQEQIRQQSEENQKKINSFSENNQSQNTQISKINQTLSNLKSEKLLKAFYKISFSEIKKVELMDKIYPIPVPENDIEANKIISKISNAVYSLVIFGIINTNNENRINEIKEIYRNAVKNAQQNELRNLKTNFNSLLAIVNRINGANKTRVIGEENKKNEFERKQKRLRFFVLGFVSFVFAIFIFAMIKSAFTGSPLPETAFKNETIYLDSATINLAIEKYELAKDTSITQWRKDRVVGFFYSKTIEPKIFVKQLDSLIVYGWQN